MLVKNDSIHSQKNTEGVLSVCVHAALPLLITSGADGLVKMFEMS